MNSMRDRETTSLCVHTYCNIRLHSEDDFLHFNTMRYVAMKRSVRKCLTK